MTLRIHQAQLQEICRRILAGENIREIILAVTPGGGKSGEAVILAAMLIPEIAAKLVWVAPRNALKRQGEAEFVDPRWQTPRRLRAANGNEPAPDRGTDGYLTTYQAIGTSPAGHQAYVAEHPTILFLDEPHHVAAGSAWARAIAPMIESADLVVWASGTFSRADGQPIHGLAYRADGLVDLRPRPGISVVTYGRKQAVADGAIIAPQLQTIDGAARWESKQGVRMGVDSLANAGEVRADAIFTALRTEFAFALLAACLEHWREHRTVYPAAKLLVVAPDIETAKSYQSRLAGVCLSEIATTDDTASAYRAIEDYKRGSVTALVTVGMAYEGLSVPEITHIACLTQIRSWPWLEQMSARANRRAPGKTAAWIFAPADRALLEAWKAIEDETLVPLSEDEGRGSGIAVEDTDLFGGLEHATLRPLWSEAHGIDAELPSGPAEITPSVAEGVLRDNIRAIRRLVVDGARAGNQMALASIFGHTIRLVAEKDLDHMDQAELTAVWIALKEKFKRRLA